MFQLMSVFRPVMLLGNLERVCPLLILGGLLASGALGFDQKLENLGFGYSFRYRTDWTVARDGNSWELNHASMPPIGIEWSSAGSRDHAKAHEIAVNTFVADYFRKYGLTLRDYGTRSTRSSNREMIYETELGTEFRGSLIRLHYQTLLLGTRLLSVVGGNIKDHSNVSYAREVASSVEAVSGNASSSRGQSPIVGRWSAPGAPNPAVVIFRADGSFEIDEPIRSWRRGKYNVSGSRVTIIWNSGAAPEVWTCHISGESLITHRPTGTVTYTKDDL